MIFIYLNSFKLRCYFYILHDICKRFYKGGTKDSLIILIHEQPQKLLLWKGLNVSEINTDSVKTGNKRAHSYNDLFSFLKKTNNAIWQSFDIQWYIFCEISSIL